MAKTKNGRIVATVAESDGVARVVKSGQRVANGSEMAAKLARYAKDPRFSEKDREMYANQLADLSGQE